jgi:hypothetical protein
VCFVGRCISQVVVVEMLLALVVLLLPKSMEIRVASLLNIKSTIKITNNGATWCAKSICTNFAKSMPLYESI